MILVYVYSIYICKVLCLVVKFFKLIKVLWFISRCIIFELFCMLDLEYNNMRGVIFFIVLMFIFVLL